MKLVERHLVKKDDPRFAVIDATAFASKNLYNQANYQIRQASIHQGKYLPYTEVFHLVKGMDCYKALPAKVANSILILLHVQIPHARFIDQLVYKAKLVGITVILQEESYTSKASFLDDDPIPTYRADQTEHALFSGKRIARSWYRTKNGTIIHADINGSYNILRKSSSDPSQLGRGVGGVAVLPRRLAV